MEKAVTQETFDSVVLENVTEFDMPVEEAISDAIKEFKAQVSSFSTVIII